MSILSQILADKRNEVDCARRRLPAEKLRDRADAAPAVRSFSGALKAAPLPALIAEVKKASPSKGIIREDFDAVAIARIYADNGAACLSVLTDEPYFQGHLRYLSAVRAAVDRPLLRKDFIIDGYQLLEARAAGADAVLLIAAALTDDKLAELLDETRALGMEAIVEAHDADEVTEALRSGATLIGVNNRDLHTFRTTIQTTLDLLPAIPSECLVISESGINRRADVERLGVAGVHAVLVGEALMREPDIAAKMHELLGQ
jgi:indole-3-glycerol phosphate synthase